MTSYSANSFSDEDNQDFDEIVDYPVIFGITMSPMVIGILCALAGVVGAIYLFTTFVGPAQEEFKRLQSEQQDLQRQVEQLRQGQNRQTIQSLNQELQRKQELKTKVLTLFTDRENLDTLLFDINSFFKRLESEDNGIKLLNYSPTQGFRQDNSWGEGLQGRILTKSINVEMEADFDKTQSILRDLERLEPLLVLKDLTTEINQTSEAENSEDVLATYEIGGRELIILRSGATQEMNKLRTQFRIDAILTRE